MSGFRCTWVGLGMVLLLGAGCENGGDGGGTKWFNRQAKSTGQPAIKAVTPVKPAKPGKSPRVNTARGVTPREPLKLEPSRGPTAIKPLKVEPSRGPAPIKPLSLEPTRVQPGDNKNWTKTQEKPITLGQPAQKPQNLWDWLATDPQINQPPAKKQDSWFSSWFKASKNRQ